MLSKIIDTVTDTKAYRRDYRLANPIPTLVDDIETVRFSEKDVVRHRLVMDIIKAYEKNEEARKRK